MIEKGLPFTFEALNAAAVAPELQGRLKFQRLPTPDNYVDVTNAWLRTLAPEFHKGLGPGLAGSVAEVLKHQFNNHYSPANLNAAFAIVRARVFQEPTPQPEPQKKIFRDTRENILALAGVKADTGRVNHAHSHEVQPVSEQQARQAVLEAVARFARSGHGRFVKTLTDAIKAQLNANESWTNILGRVQEYASDYTGTLLIKQMIEQAPGGTTGARAATRERFARIAQEGRKGGMKASEIARIIRIESEGLSNRSIS